MNENIVSFKKEHGELFILINGKVHLYTKLSEFIAFKAWIESEKEYHIQYTFSNRSVIDLEYRTRDLWEKILDVLYKEF